MITTKNNFKGMLRRRYPEVVAFPIYGIPGYILDRPLNDIDMFEYNVQQLPNGKYVVFLGISVAEATELMQTLVKGGIPKSSRQRVNKNCPTTFSSFEAWMDRNNVTPLNRTFCNNMTPIECLQTDCIDGKVQPFTKGTWYMYELPGYLAHGEYLANVPHVTIEYPPRNSPNPEEVAIVLIKASSSRYKSRRQRFVEKFQLMQPIYEQLIAACAIATVEEDNAKWDTAYNLCNQYMSTQFECEGTVDLEAMKEAYKNGTIGLFTRDKGNLRQEDPEAF